MVGGVTDRRPARKEPPLRTALAIVLVALAALAPALAGAAPASPSTAGDRTIARAEALSAHWGRCPTSRPAHRALAAARRTAAPHARVKRARAAVRAWTAVAADCSQPVAQPTVRP